ncbi:MAG: hypothetical protein ABIR32_03265 [Ilumatobacteraceae bacterium]
MIIPVPPSVAAGSIPTQAARPKATAVCLAKEVVSHVVRTRCGVTTTFRDATIWRTEVTCRHCISGHQQLDEHAASIASLLRSN